ncbi:MAG: hypothetical protein IPK27_09040 [Rhodanobacteraceae bacterium]|nr:hypothetical protein [Rhodanobacteraceae bacterium]
MEPAAQLRPADAHAIAESVRAQLIAVALDAWERAGLAGLCHEGRFEFLIGALQRAPLDAGSHGPDHRVA